MSGQDHSITGRKQISILTDFFASLKAFFFTVLGKKVNIRRLGQISK